MVLVELQQQTMVLVAGHGSMVDCTRAMAAWWTRAMAAGGGWGHYVLWRRVCTICRERRGIGGRGGEGGRGPSTLNCTALLSQLCSLPPLRCSVVQSLNHRKLAGLLKREEGHWAASGRPGVGIRELGREERESNRVIGRVMGRVIRRVIRRVIGRVIWRERVIGRVRGENLQQVPTGDATRLLGV